MALLVRNIPRLRVNPQRTLCCLPQNQSSRSPLFLFRPPTTPHTVFGSLSTRFYSTQNPPPNNTPVTLQQKLKKAVAEYGSTVIVFHVGISLLSLGVCYLLVSSGLDAQKVMSMVGIEATKVAASAGTFAVAYAVHKVFAPARIMVTLTATPFIVRYLRQVGFLKKPPQTK
ncbi:hypothetical protein Zmor_015971 [Zophobas morio]|uniref:DUF1279 domain-containing protein n=1 Tax=Zophobas morio TaxID=2755281 RepID=A0AA38IKD5_9CUCU|nr:hypothetical protein Zmor_015971 [Zophobas morio]